MHKVYPVIHHLDFDTTLNEAKLAHSCGADGIFLISHNNQDSQLATLGKTIKSYQWLNDEDNPFFVGLNLLNTQAIQAFKIVKDAKLDGLWLDNAGINSSVISPMGSQLIELSAQFPLVEVFAGVAFKYQEPEPEPLLAAQRVRQLGWIPTTSGTGTGKAPDLDKIKGMHESEKTLAIASGMTCKNIDQFLPYLTHILIASGISYDEHHFDEQKLSDFIDIVKNY